jgi:hypothetical protein
MGIIDFPTVECYWKTDIIYGYELFHKISIKYNRFVLLLRCWHFADNEGTNNGNRLYKIQLLIDVLRRKVRTLYIPGDTVVVDETMIPFRGRVLFKQYNPSKASKYGIKLYKVCTPQGFTWDVSIQAGSGENLNGLDLSGSKVVRLTEQVLDEGRLVITDNYYTSIGLAEFLLSRKTNLLGTIRKHRKGLPVCLC